MKQALLALGMLATLPAYAQFTRTYTGAITTTDPVVSGDRLYRDGSAGACGATKTFPGVSSGVSGVHYDSYLIANRNATTNCVTLTLTHSCTEAATPLIFLSVYTNTFAPANVSTNYKSDAGSSPQSGTTATMSVTLAANETVTLVVNALTSAAVCSSYSLAVSAPQVLPTIQAVSGDDAVLTAYPNPVADVLYIATAKAGSYTLFNTTGTAVRQINGTEVPMGELPGGVYLLQDNGTKRTTHVVKL